MRKDQEHQGPVWRRLDNTAKLFPVIANENLSSVFRVSATLKEAVDPECLQRALEEVLPWFDGFAVRLRRGFFWYYFEHNKRTPLIEKENSYPCKFIAPRGSRMFLFRVSYYRNRINLEVFHAITDGMGAVQFLRELTYRYLQLAHHLNEGDREEAGPSDSCIRGVEDSYLKIYRKMKRKKYSTERSFHLTGRPLPLDAENILHGYVELKALKRVCVSHGVSITKYLTACLIWSIYQVYLGGKPCAQAVGVNLPINLRAFFDSNTSANFFAVTAINFLAEKESYGFEEILQLVDQQMDEKIVKEKLEETISYNVSNEKKWYLRAAPLFMKWAALSYTFRRNERAHTVTLSNLGPVKIEPEYRQYIERFHFVIGVSPRQNMKCGVCAFGNEVVVTFSTVFDDTGLSEYFFGFLRERGIGVELESNGAVSREYDRGSYPEIHYDAKKWKKLLNSFYLVLFALAAILGAVNLSYETDFFWSGIALAGIAYTVVTVRYSVFRHANLGSKIMIQTLGAQALLVIIDHLTGYRGWSVNYAVPSTILFADVAVVFLIIVNRLNWQSYFMYQLTITIFSFIPVILWAVGWITNPVMAVITVIVTVLVLTLTVLMGDRSVKNELIRRFHL